MCCGQLGQKSPNSTSASSQAKAIPGRWFCNVSTRPLTSLVKRVPIGNGWTISTNGIQSSAAYAPSDASCKSNEVTVWMASYAKVRRNDIPISVPPPKNFMIHSETHGRAQIYHMLDIKPSYRWMPVLNTVRLILTL